jgi:hypothetical protein
MYIIVCFYKSSQPAFEIVYWHLFRKNIGTMWILLGTANSCHRRQTKLMNHQWTPAELLNFKVPSPRWTMPIQRGRPSVTMPKLYQQWVD